MLVVKKKVLIIASILFIIVLSLLTAFSISYSSSQIVPKKLINVVVDAGHGGIDGGGIGYSKKIYESDINLSIALKLQYYLQTADIGVIMTRTDKNGLYGNTSSGFKKRDMLKRQEIISNSNADFCVSIHLNTYMSTSRKGAQTFFNSKSELGIKAAKKIQNEFNKNINLDREYSALKGDYYILNCSKIPSVIAECGFITNPEEEQLLITAEYQDKIAYNIFSGILSYFYEISLLEHQTNNI